MGAGGFHRFKRATNDDVQSYEDALSDLLAQTKHSVELIDNVTEATIKIGCQKAKIALD